MAEGTASGVPREAFQPGDLAFPQISAPARAPRPPVFTLRKHSSPSNKTAERGAAMSFSPQDATWSCTPARTGRTRGGGSFRGAVAEHGGCPHLEAAVRGKAARLALLQRAGAALAAAHRRCQT